MGRLSVPEDGPAAAGSFHGRAPAAPRRQGTHHVPARAEPSLGSPPVTAGRGRRVGVAGAGGSGRLVEHYKQLTSLLYAQHTTELRRARRADARCRRAAEERRRDRRPRGDPHGRRREALLGAPQWHRAKGAPLGTPPYQPHQYNKAYDQDLPSRGRPGGRGDRFVPDLRPTDRQSARPNRASRVARPALHDAHAAARREAVNPPSPTQADSSCGGWPVCIWSSCPGSILVRICGLFHRF